MGLIGPQDSAASAIRLEAVGKPRRIFIDPSILHTCRVALTGFVAAGRQDLQNPPLQLFLFGRGEITRNFALKIRAGR
jgi:hypothetical protein